MRQPKFCFFSLIWLALTGCRNKATPENTSTQVIYVEPDDTGMAVAGTLSFSLDATASEAGESVGYELSLVDEEGAALEMDWALQSDLEAQMQHSVESVSPTYAGVHTITAVVQDDWGSLYEASASLDVSASTTHWVDLELSDIGTYAGEEITYSVTAEDVYGNAVDASSALVEVDDDAVTISSDAFVSTLPGVYMATATLDEVSDFEVFEVTPGEPVAVELTLSSEQVELYETTSGAVAVSDEYGNLTDDPWTITVEGDGITSVSYNNITFFEEGAYIVWVNVDDTELWDSVGPLTVDSTGPSLEVTHPEHGDWVEGDQVTVSGWTKDEVSGVTSLEINEAPATVDGDGNFSESVPLDFGMNLIETVATDGDGNENTDLRALLAGDFVTYGDPVSSGISARLHDGEGGLDVLDSMGEGLLVADDLDALIPSPVYSEEEEDCWDWGWLGSGCITWYSVDLYISNPSIGETELDLDAMSVGQIRAIFTLYDPALDWDADLVGLEIPYSEDGDITADDITVTMYLDPYVDGGQLYMDVTSVTASATNFDFDIDGWLWEVLDYFGMVSWVDSLVQGYLEDAIEDAVYDAVPDLLADALQGLEISTEMESGDRTFFIDAVPEDAEVDGTGMTVFFESTVIVDSWESAYTGLGSLFYGYSEPAWATSMGGTVMGISLDFLNQVLYAFWGGGLLDYELSGDELGLDVEDLAVFLPSISSGSLSLVVEPLLPPVVVPGTGAAMMDLQIGDMLLTIYDGEPSTGTVFMEVYVSTVVGLDFVADGDTELVAETSDEVVYFDVIYPESGTQAASDTEALLELLVPILLPDLAETIGSIPLPELEGLTLTGIDLDMEGAEDGVLIVGGDLTE